MTRRFVQLGLVASGTASIGAGIWLLSFEDELFGDRYRPFVEVGLAFVVLGLPPLLLIGLQLAWPQLGSALIGKLNRVTHLPLTALALAGIGVLLFAITDGVDGVMMYHPYDVLGLALIALAGIVLVRWLMRLRAPAF